MNDPYPLVDERKDVDLIERSRNSSVNAGYNSYPRARAATRHQDFRRGSFWGVCNFDHFSGGCGLYPSLPIQCRVLGGAAILPLWQELRHIFITEPSLPTPATSWGVSTV